MILEDVEPAYEVSYPNDYSGRAEIGLDDLDKYIYLSFNQKGECALTKICKNIDEEFRALEACERYLDGVSKSISVESLSHLVNRYSVNNPEDLKLEDFDGYVSSLKSGKNGKVISTEGLPIDFEDESWGFILGMLPDTNVKKYNLKLTSGGLADEVKDRLKAVGVSCEVLKRDDGFKIEGGSILGNLMLKSGFVRYERQVEYNVRFPKWVYRADNESFHKSIMAAIIESEGSAPTSTTRSCRITQANSVSGIEITGDFKEERTPTGHTVRRKYFHDLSAEQRKYVLRSQPPLLESVKKLLKKYDINSQLRPEAVTETKKTTAALWNLSISGEDIKLLYEFCEDCLVSKKKSFQDYIDNKEEWHVNKGERFAYYMDKIRELCNQEGYVTSKMLAGYIDREEKTVGNTLSILSDRNKIECIGYRDRYKCWRPVDN